MSTTVEKIALELLGLPAKSRALLAEKLIKSLDEKQNKDIEALLRYAAGKLKAAKLNASRQEMS